jgi:GDPmannose 4,6-dehydratase
VLSKKSAFITGMAGQDGSYLAEYLLAQGYEVHGTVRRNSTPEHQVSRIDHLENRIHTYYADLTDPNSISRLVRDIQPHEFYNIAGQSHVRISFDIPNYTLQVNAQGALNMLEIIREVSPSTRYYQASSSEMFGNFKDPDGMQRESTSMHPVSPYGCSKLYAYHATRTYRKSYGLFAANGILFNHESPRRASNFVTGKIVKAAVEISLGLRETLALGNLESFRDWGHSRDYVMAMHRILQMPEPLDLVIATGQTRSVRDFCNVTFDALGLNYLDYVTQDARYMRPQELDYLCGDSSLARKTLEWEPETSFEKMIEEMITHWQTVLTS